MRIRLGFIVVLAAAAWLLPRGADAARPKIAVLGVESRDEGNAASRQKSAALAKTLTFELRSRAESGGYELAAGGNKDLIELKLLSECMNENATCMIAIARQLGVDVLVYGHLEKRRGAYSVNLYSVDAATKKVKKLDISGVSAPSDEGMRKVASSAPLVAPSADDGTAPSLATLIVRTNVPASVSVNGTPRGATAEGQPLIIGDLAPGPVKLAVEAPGHQRYESSVEVRPDSKTDLSVSLEPAAVAARPVPAPAMPTPAQSNEPPERPGKTARVLFWTSLVTTGVGVAAFTITGLQVRSIENEASDPANGSFSSCKDARAAAMPNPKIIDICDRGESMATVTNVLIGATAVAAVATAFFYWRGYMSTSESDSARTAKLMKPIVVPEVYKNGAGLSTVLRF